MKKKAIIKLNKLFYDCEAIEQALKDFSKICEGKIIDQTYSVEFSMKNEVENLPEEFSNYVLGLMKHNQLI